MAMINKSVYAEERKGHNGQGSSVYFARKIFVPLSPTLTMNPKTKEWDIYRCSCIILVSQRNNHQPNNFNFYEKF